MSQRNTSLKFRLINGNEERSVLKCPWGTSVIVDGGEVCIENLHWNGRAFVRGASAFVKMIMDFWFP